jgi:hypothetical protein
MPFSYYYRLSPGRQAIYRASDRVTEVRLPAPTRLHGLVDSLREALAEDDRRRVQAAAAALSDALLAQLGVSALEVRVLAVRPRGRWGELHGLYTYGEKDPPRIKLWMRTARQREVVAFRTFLRTLLHEVGHHLDYHFLKLHDSYHTEGFFARESSLFRQLVPDAPAARAKKADGAVRSSPRSDQPPSRPPKRSQKPTQGRLPFDD